MSDLLDAFTKFVAYLGDDSARDGYLTGHNAKGVPQYSINMGPGVSPQFIVQIVKLIHLNLTTGKEIKGKLAPAIKKKVDEFIALVNAGPEEQKPELLAYMAEYNLDDDGRMQGGARHMKGRSSSRTTKKSNKRRGGTRRSAKRSNRK
jgi:hypothetical protein